MRTRFRLHVALSIVLTVLTGALSACSAGQAGDGPRGGATTSPAGTDANGVAFTAASNQPDPQGLEVPSQSGARAEFALDPGDAEWTMAIHERGGVEIRCQGVPVVTGLNQYWSQGPTWANPGISAKSRSHDAVRIGGGVKGLALNVDGVAQALSPHALRVDMEIVASQPMSGVPGGGITWKLQLQSPALRGKAGDPILLSDGTGWRWPVGAGQEISVRFDEPITRVYFEKNQKSEIRTQLVGSRIQPGRSRYRMTVTLPEGGKLVTVDEEKYARPTRDWYPEALPWDASPIDLSFLNAGERPAGRHGPIKVDGDRLVFQDGTPARFWGTNLAGPVLFLTPRENIPLQARRISKLGYNLVRIHQQDSNWVNPNIFGKNYQNTRQIDPAAIDMIDQWIKCLKDEGIYIWLDLHYMRPLKPGDPVSLGRDEIAREKNLFWGFNYLNPELQELMKRFQHQYLSHVNRYTGIAYKSDPAVIGVLITNENDMTFHFGLRFLPVKNNPVHQNIFEEKGRAFAEASGMAASRIWKTWEPGPGKYLLSALEHDFNAMMIKELRTMGVHAPLATTNLWGPNVLFSLPPLTDGDVTDVHDYGEGEALSADPRYQKTFPGAAAMARVHGKPMMITEWNIPYPILDRFTAPLYMASIAALQGWDAPMIYNYAQRGLERPGNREWNQRIDKWATYNDPAITGIMPAAAIAFRRGHIRPSAKHYYLKLTPEQLLDAPQRPDNTATIRTLVEQSRISIGMPAVPQLPWLKPTTPSEGDIVITDPDHSYVADDQTSVTSDTGELVRDWKQGVQLIDTPRTQAVSGWIGGKTLNLKDASFRFKTPKAVVALSSIDDEPLAASRFILISAVAQAHPSPATDMGKALPDRPANHLPYLSEPVVGTIKLRTRVEGLDLLCLGPDGKVVSHARPVREQDTLTVSLPAGKGTHWYVLKVPAAQKPPGQAP